MKLTLKVFFFVPCRFGSMTCTLACVYILPPFTTAVFRFLIAYLDGRPNVPLLVVGDFNCCLNTALDRHPGPSSSVLSRGSLARLLQEVGWVDILRYLVTLLNNLHVFQNLMVAGLELTLGWVA